MKLGPLGLAPHLPCLNAFVACSDVRGVLEAGLTEAPDLSPQLEVPVEEAQIYHYLKVFKASYRFRLHTVPPQNYWSLCATRDDCICMLILSCAIVL